MGDSKTGQIKAILRFSDIIDYLIKEEPLSSREVADKVDIANSTAHAYLSTMEDLRLVKKTPDGYRLSLKFLQYGIHERNQLSVIDTSKEILEQLAADTGEAVYLIVEEFGQAVFVDRFTGQRAVSLETRIGTRAPLHTHAAGKALLAHLSREKVEQIIRKNGLPAETQNAIRSSEELFSELDQISEKGYALNDEESMKGVRAVGAPIQVEDEVVAAISISGPANRITDSYIEGELLNELLTVVNEIELFLEN